MDEKFTVGDMKRLLDGLPDDDELAFEGGLTISRLKRRGDDLIVAEFNQFQAMLSENFKRKFPEVQVAFCSWESDGSVVQEVSVPEL
jgi:hypothetical protein